MLNKLYKEVGEIKVNKTLSKIKKDYGFTIVELLVVIVVIGILAAITIVSYTGVSNRAQYAKSQSNADSTRSIAETMYSDNGYYPGTSAAFTAGSTSTKLPSSITVVQDTATTPLNGATFDANNVKVAVACVTTTSCAAGDT